MRYLGRKTDSDDLATQGDLSGGGAAATPSGVVSAFAGSSAPSGWLLCDGSTVSRTTYSDLFAVIGTTYGSGDGSTTFTLPSLKGRMPVGLDSGQTEFDALAETGGAKTVTLATTEIPSHSPTSGTLATDTEAAHSHTSGTLVTDTAASHTHGDGTLATDTEADHSHADGTLATDYEAAHTHTSGTYTGYTSLASASLSFSTLNSVNNSGNQTGVVRNLSLATTNASTDVYGNSGSNGGHDHDVTGLTGDGGSHSHDVTGSTGSAGEHSHAVNGSTDTAGSHSHSVNSGSTGSTGGGSGHNNLSPYVVMNYIIKT